MIIQGIYSEPIKEELIGQRVREIKRPAARCLSPRSCTPANTKKLRPDRR